MQQFDYRQFPGLLILFTFLFPTFPSLTRSDTAGRIGDMVLVIGILSLIVLYVFLFNRSVKVKTFAIASFFTGLFFALISLSILSEINFISLRDIYEYHKPIMIFLIFFFFQSIDWTSDSLQKYFLRPFIFIFSFFTCYGIIEAFTGSIGQSISTIFYKTSRPILVGKSTGSFGITYFFATLMLFSSFFFFFRYILKRNRGDLFWTLGSIICMLATQSRTIFIAFAFGLLYVFLSYWLFRDFPFKRKLYLSTLVTILLVVIFWTPLMEWVSNAFPYLYYGINYLIEQGGVNAEGAGSANVRYQQLIWAWENQFTYPLIGAGIGKATGPQLESFYALYLYRYGIIGILLAVFLLIFNYVLSIKCFRISRKLGDLDASAFFIAFSVFCFVLPICSLSSVITDQVRLAVLYYGSSAVMIGYYRYAKKKDGFSIVE